MAEGYTTKPCTSATVATNFQTKETNHLVRLDLTSGKSLKISVDDGTFELLTTDPDYRTQWVQQYEANSSNSPTAPTPTTSDSIRTDGEADPDYRTQWVQQYEANSSNSPTAHTPTTSDSIRTDGEAGQNWNHEKTLCLIDLYQKNAEKMQNPKYRKRCVWDEITVELNTVCASHFKVSQVEGRWKTILCSYRKCKDAKKLSGGARKTYEYEDRLDEILKDSDTTEPAYTFSSGNMSSCSKSGGENDEKETTKKVKSSNVDKVITCLESLIEKSEEKETRRQEEARQMHREKIDVFKSLVDVLKK